MVGVILMSDEGIDVVVAELVGPAELLLERVVLVVVFAAAAAAVVALTVTDDCRVVALLGVRAQVDVAVEDEGKVSQEVEFRSGDGIHRIADGDVLVQLVLPDDVTVHKLVSGVDLDTVLVIIVTGVILFVSVGIEDVFARGDIVEMDRIDRSDTAAVHERVGD